jgi:segregation and condensation protein B
MSNDTTSENGQVGSDAEDASAEPAAPEEAGRDAERDPPARDPDEAVAAGDASPSASDADSDGRLTQVVEALIFAADDPVTGDRIGDIYAEVTGQAAPGADTIDAAVDRLNATYDADGRAMRIERWAGGYQMATREAMAPFVKTLYVGEQEQSLSRSLLETLAVVAYKQPVTRPEVDFIRGVNSDYAIRKLLEMGLADVEGRSDSMGRPLLYGTTDRFLEQFGLDTLDDLPTLREVEDLLDDPTFDKERAELLQLKAEKEGLTDSPGASDTADLADGTDKKEAETKAPNPSSDASAEPSDEEEGEAGSAPSDAKRSEGG